MSDKTKIDENFKKVMNELKKEIATVESPEQRAALEKRLDELWAAIGEEEAECDLWQVNATTFLV